MKNKKNCCGGKPDMKEGGCNGGICPVSDCCICICVKELKKILTPESRKLLINLLKEK